MFRGFMIQNPEIVTEKAREEAMTLTRETVKKFDELRRELDLPPEQLTLIAEVFGMHLETVAATNMRIAQRERTRRQREANIARTGTAGDLRRGGMVGGMVGGYAAVPIGVPRIRQIPDEYVPTGYDEALNELDELLDPSAPIPNIDPNPTQLPDR
jgi:hypothetical protein